MQYRLISAQTSWRVRAEGFWGNLLWPSWITLHTLIMIKPTHMDGEIVETELGRYRVIGYDVEDDMLALEEVIEDVEGSIWVY